ncbi:MAG: 30S ribosomal protein S1, partial [Muribaculaceae bacterium]|nr:30S ribosomal protein S1 [Muribaculaceae bacterium]
AKLDEKLNFKVSEFNKASKRLILSHSRIAEDANKAEVRPQRPAAKKPRREEEAVATPSIEKTTLGDLGALQALKEQMQKEERK